MLVKASIAGAIVTNTLFMLGASFLLGGMRHHVQEFNRVSARLQAGLLFLATVALLMPSAVAERRRRRSARRSRRQLSVGLAVLLIVAYALGMLFSLKTHREMFAQRRTRRATARRRGRSGWRWRTLAGVTVLVALVSEIFVESVQKAAETFGMTPAFVGFIVVALVGGAAEMASAFSGARKNRLDLSVGIALGSAAQIALFVAPVLVLLSYVIGPTPMDLQFWPGAVVMMLIATLTASLVTNSGRRVVRRRARPDGVRRVRQTLYLLLRGPDLPGGRMDARAMRHRFVTGLVTGLRVVWPILSALLGLIVALGLVVGLREGWSIQESIYFAFVSGLTIGYGDFAPKFLLTRVLAVVIGLCGVLLTALVAAIAVKALTAAQDPSDD